MGSSIRRADAKRGSGRCKLPGSRRRSRPGAARPKGSKPRRLIPPLPGKGVKAPVSARLPTGRREIRWYRGCAFALSRKARGGFLFPPAGDLGLALAGGGGFFRPLRAGRIGGQRWLGNAPPILSFAKRENAPCTVEERKRGRARGASGSRHVSSPRRGAGGGLSCEESSALLFPLPLTWRLEEESALWGPVP